MPAGAVIRCRVGRMEFSLRPFVSDDIEQVVALSLRAWEPVHASLARVLGPDINPHVTPDWRQSQEAGVRKACAEQLTTVAVQDEAVVGFVSVLIDRRSRARSSCWRLILRRSVEVWAGH